MLLIFLFQNAGKVIRKALRDRVFVFKRRCQYVKVYTAFGIFAKEKCGKKNAFTNMFVAAKKNV